MSNPAYTWPTSTSENTVLYDNDSGVIRANEWTAPTVLNRDSHGELKWVTMAPAPTIAVDRQGIFDITADPEHIRINGQPLTQVIHDEAGFATWSQRAVDGAFGFVAGALFSAMLVVFVASRLGAGKVRRGQPVREWPTESVR